MKKIHWSNILAKIQIGGVNLITSANWEQGTGIPEMPAGTTYENLKASMSTRIRSKNIIPVNGRCVVSIENLSYRFLVYLFDQNQLYLGQSSGEITWRQNTLYLPETTKYIAVLLSRVDGGTINLSEYFNARLKVERGNFPTTDWHPSWEDLQFK